MYKLVIDLEMAGNAPVGEGRARKFIKEIIEIGAVLLDEDNNTIKKFETYVQPRYSRVTKSIERLTGITDEMLVGAPYFEDAIADIIKELPEDVLLCTWSDSDTNAIKKEIDVKGLNIERLEELCENYFDIQREFSDKLNFGHILNLEKALNLVGIDFKGKAHGALDDAINTAKLYTSMYGDEEVMESIRNINDAMTPTPLTSSLGSMIDFSKFNLS